MRMGEKSNVRGLEGRRRRRRRDTGEVQLPMVLRHFCSSTGEGTKWFVFFVFFSSQTSCCTASCFIGISHGVFYLSRKMVLCCLAFKIQTKYMSSICFV